MFFFAFKCSPSLENKVSKIFTILCRIEIREILKLGLIFYFQHTKRILLSILAMPLNELSGAGIKLAVKENFPFVAFSYAKS